MAKMKKIKSIPIIGILILLVLALSACGGADTSALEVNQADIATQAAELQESIGSQKNVDSPPAPEKVESPAEDAPVPVSNEPAELPVIPRIDLGANWFVPTNPIGVSIASEGLQIIEFSAYW